MPADITPVSAWTTPLQTPAGSDVANAASVENAVQKLANRVEFLKDKALGGSTTWPHSNVVQVPISEFRIPYDSPSTDIRIYQSAADYHVNAAADSLVAVWNLQRDLRTNMELTAIQIAVIPGEARATTGNRITATLLRKAHNYLFPDSEGLTAVAVASAHDDGTAPQQGFTISGLTESIDRLGYEYSLSIKFGSTATAHPDILLAITLVFNNPGPRNE